jgi:predicted NBD/HSP70 family sugar kinase
MSDTATAPSSLAAHGGLRLPSVEIDSYNIEARDQDGFIGDNVNKSAFRDMLERWRKPLRKNGDDPLGKKSSKDFTKDELTEFLSEGEPEAAGVVQGAIEDFAQELATIIRRFIKLKGWRDTERIVIGGGFRGSRIGELAIGRAEVVLRADKTPIDLVPIRNDPDEAGLIGAAHLAPDWISKGHDSLLAVDIGGTNIRAGIVDLKLKRAPDLSKACVWKSELWRHGDTEKV